MNNLFNKFFEMNGSAHLYVDPSYRNIGTTQKCKFRRSGFCRTSFSQDAIV